MRSRRELTTAHFFISPSIILPPAAQELWSGRRLRQDRRCGAWSFFSLLACVLAVTVSHIRRATLEGRVSPWVGTSCPCLVADDKQVIQLRRVLEDWQRVGMPGSEGMTSIGVLGRQKTAGPRLASDTSSNSWFSVSVGTGSGCSGRILPGTRFCHPPGSHDLRIQMKR